MSKSGFSTLNRWLGRKNKDKNSVNGKLSKSNTNLSISSSTINENYQLEYNRITPLPIATSNAPFEQTFRITVLLPKDQLYVARLGARVPLSKLLELVCDNKLLDADKYEFRNPIDPSQVYSCDLTIGAMGLSEIRLCHKSESYDTFNADAVIKLHRTSIMRDSLTSSEFSSRFSKQTLKTTSPYSSTNSLNSMDSSGLNYTRSPLTIANGNGVLAKISAPPRKKRNAPKPPTAITQVSIPEQEQVPIDNSTLQHVSDNEDAEKRNLDLPDVSEPNLNSTLKPDDFDEQLVSANSLPTTNGNGYTTEDTALYAQVCKKNALNLGANSKPSDELDNTSRLPTGNFDFPEPSPRKRIIPVKKKSAPAPPPRNHLYLPEDNTSLSSTNVSMEFNATARSLPTSKTKITSTTEQEARTQTESNENPATTSRQYSGSVIEENITNGSKEPQATPAAAASPTVLNIEATKEPTATATTVAAVVAGGQNISKVLLNRTPTPEPDSLSHSQSPDIIHACYDNHIGGMPHSSTFADNTSEDVYDDDDDAASKQADSGIGETVPSPIPDSLPSAEVSSLECKANFETSSSSDDDDLVKVYNFKLGKTLVKPLNDTTPNMDELPVVSEETDHTSPPLSASLTNTDKSFSDATSPISPPPYFADGKLGQQNETDATSDTPITPKLTEHPTLNFKILQNEEDSGKYSEQSETLQKNPELSANSASTPLDGLVEELSYILQEKGLNSLIHKPKTCSSIETVKANNTLDNFQISSLSKTEAVVPNAEQNFQDAKPKSASPVNTSNEEKSYHTRTQTQPRHSITRADSFHSTVLTASSLGNDVARSHVVSEHVDGCLKGNRSCSQLSLNQLEQNAVNFNGRRSSSELSIQESPSLQSLEVIKTILNNTNNMKNWNTNISNNNHNNKLTPKINKLETAGGVGAEADVPKLYRYSGPPSIDVGTWNERPKSQVAIKNEGDYIFGGKTLAEKRQIFKNSSTKPHPLPSTVSTTATLNRMSLPQRDYRLPIQLKPLKDVAGKEKHVANRVALEQPNQATVNTCTLPRVNRTLYNKQKFVHPVTEAETEKPVPFGQIHLRHTGLKEKILAKELPECAYQTHNGDRDHPQKKTNEISSTPSLMLINKKRIQFKTASKSMTAAATECDLKSTISTPQIQLPKSSNSSPQLQQLNSKTASETTLSSTKKTNGFSDHQHGSDPRDELMNAIRNFNRMQLKKS